MAARPTIGISGKRLALARQARYLSQRELGELAGVTDETIGRIERSEVGNILANRIPRLAAALKMTEAEFIAELAVQPNGADAQRADPASDISDHAKEALAASATWTNAKIEQEAKAAGSRKDWELAAALYAVLRERDVSADRQAKIAARHKGK